MQHFAVRGLMLSWVVPGLAVAAALGADPPGRVTVLRDLPWPSRAVVRIGTDEFRTQEHIRQLAFSPDGKWIAAVAAYAPFPMLVLFDVETGRPAKRLDVPDARLDNTSCIAFSPDGGRLVWGETNGCLALWNLVEDRLVFREKLHAAEISHVVFSPRGNLVASCSVDGHLGVRQAADLAEPVRLMILGDANHKGADDQFLKIAGYLLAFTPDGGQLVIGGKRDAGISVWNVANGEFHRQVESAHGDGRAGVYACLNHLAMAPDGRVMSAGQQTVPRANTKMPWGPPTVPLSQVRFWDLKTGDRSAIELGGEDYGLGYAALAPDGKQVVVADAGRLTFWDVSSGKRIRSTAVPAWMGRLPVYSPDGTIVAVPVDNAIAIFDTATGRRLHHDTETAVGAVRLCSSAPAGDRIATVNTDDGICRVWQAETGKLICSQELVPATEPGEAHSYPAMAGEGATQNNASPGHRPKPHLLMLTIVA